jgi:hypothetical protein
MCATYVKPIQYVDRNQLLKFITSWLCGDTKNMSVNWVRPCVVKFECSVLRMTERKKTLTKEKDFGKIRLVAHVHTRLF